jgi:hypothetical protein
MSARKSVAAVVDVDPCAPIDLIHLSQLQVRLPLMLHASSQLPVRRLQVSGCAWKYQVVVYANGTESTT